MFLMGTATKLQLPRIESSFPNIIEVEPDLKAGSTILLRSDNMTTVSQLNR